MLYRCNMAFTLVYVVSRVPQIPQHSGSAQAGSAQAGVAHAGPRGLPPDRREHFGTEEAALRRVRELLPAAEWIDLCLFGPDGRLIAGQHALETRLGLGETSWREGGGHPAPG